MNIVSIAQILHDPEIKTAIRRNDNIRTATLDICYQIPGYAQLTRPEKNQIYDRIRQEIEKAWPPTVGQDVTTLASQNRTC